MLTAAHLQSPAGPSVAGCMSGSLHPLALCTCQLGRMQCLLAAPLPWKKRQQPLHWWQQQRRSGTERRRQLQRTVLRLALARKRCSGSQLLCSLRSGATEGRPPSCALPFAAGARVLKQVAHATQRL